MNSRLDKGTLATTGFTPLPNSNDALQGHSASADSMQEAGKLRVLWISHECSLQDGNDNPCLCARHEAVVAKHGADNIQLAIAYMADGKRENVVVRNGIVYYAVAADMGLAASVEEWDKARTQIIRIVNDFKPDVIQCFGAEWPYGAIAEDVDVPVVVHMMGFLNAYFPVIDNVRGDVAPAPIRTRGIKAKLGKLLHKQQVEAPRIEERLAARERAIMAANRFFLGRTTWDRGIVEQYAPGATYYHVPEAVKQPIFDAAGTWNYHHEGRLRIFSLAAADDRKGIDVIFRAAQILKDRYHLDFEWVLAGNNDALPQFEQRTGIDHTQVNLRPIGYVGCTRIIEELQAADFFVHPSIIDNSPHAVCEAQLVGCPVIASNVGGVPDLVEDGMTGFLYPCDEPHALASLLADSRQDARLLIDVSKRAVQTAVERHDPKAIADALAQVYRDVRKRGRA